MAEVLVVDNNRHITTLLNEVLSKDGHQVTAIGDGSEALNLIYKKEFDIAFIDLVLPGIDGLYILKTLKRESPQTVAIVMSGRNDFNAAIDSIKLGVYDYLRKPFDIDDILKITKSASAEQKRMLDVGYAYKYEPYTNKHNRVENILSVATNIFMVVLALFAGFALQVGIFQSIKIPLFWGVKELIYLLASFACCYGFIISRNNKNSRYFIGKQKLSTDIAGLTWAYIVFVAILFFLKKIYFADFRLALMFGYMVGIAGLRFNRFILVPRLAGLFARQREGKKSIIIIGSGKKADELFKLMQKRFGRNSVINVVGNDVSLYGSERVSSYKDGRSERNRYSAHDPKELFLDGNALDEKKISSLITDFNGRRVTINLTNKSQEKSSTFKPALS